MTAYVDGVEREILNTAAASPAPGLPGLDFVMFGSDGISRAANFDIGRNGHVAFLAELQDAQDRVRGSLWIDRGSGDPTHIYIEGEAATGVPKATFVGLQRASLSGFVDFNSRPYGLGDKGTLAFSAFAQVVGESEPRSGLRVNRGGTTELALLSGTLLPGSPDVTVTDIPRPIVGTNGHTAIVVETDAGPTTWAGVAPQALLVERGGALETVFRPTDATPGFELGSIYTEPLVSPGGDVFFSTQSLPSDAAGDLDKHVQEIWTTRGGEPRVIASSEDVALGTGGNRLFFPVALAAGAGGRAVIASQILDPNSTGSAGEGLWVYDPASDDLVPLAITGQLFDVDPDPDRTDLREISNTGFESTFVFVADPRDYAITDDGRFTFALEFTDGSSGLFTATIPTPGGVGIALLGLGGAARRKR